MEIGISTSIRNEIMMLFGNLRPEQKEDVAKASIPIVTQAKTEQDAYNETSKLIEQTV